MLAIGLENIFLFLFLEMNDNTEMLKVMYYIPCYYQNNNFI